MFNLYAKTKNNKSEILSERLRRDGLPFLLFRFISSGGLSYHLLAVDNVDTLDSLANLATAQVIDCRSSRSCSIHVLYAYSDIRRNVAALIVEGEVVKFEPAHTIAALNLTGPWVYVIGTETYCCHAALVNTEVE